MSVSHQPRSELNSSTTSSASRSPCGSSDGEYATMTRHLSNSDTPRSPRGLLDYESLTRSRDGSRSTVSRSTSSDVSGGDDSERVMMRSSIVLEASESDDDVDDDDDSHNNSDYVLYNPAKPSPPPPLPPSPGAVFNDDCGTTERSAGAERPLRPRIQSASVLPSSRLCDEELQVSDVL